MGTRKEDEWGPLKRPVRGPGIPVAPRDHRIDAFFPSLSAFLLFSFLSLPFPSNGSSFTASHKSTRHYRIMRISTADIRTREVFWSVRMVLFFEIVCFCFLYIWKARNLIREKLIVKHEELCNRGNFALEAINVSNGLQIFLFF